MKSSACSIESTSSSKEELASYYYKTNISARKIPTLWSVFIPISFQEPKKQSLDPKRCHKNLELIPPGFTCHRHRFDVMARFVEFVTSVNGSANSDSEF